MQREKLSKNQINMFTPTYYGTYEPYKPENNVKFCGSDYEPKKDYHRLKSKFLTVFNIVKNWDWFTYDELYKVTKPLDINDDTASRNVRRIGETRFKGYFVYKKKENGFVKFRCVKLDTQYDN